MFHQELGALIRLKDTDAGLGFSLELFIHLTIKYSDVLKYHNTDMGIQGRDRLVTWTVEGNNLDDVVVDVGVAELSCDGDLVGSKDKSETVSSDS